MLVENVVLLDRGKGFGKETYGTMREEWKICQASQISQRDPGDQY